MLVQDAMQLATARNTRLHVGRKEVRDGRQLLLSRCGDVGSVIGEAPVECGLLDVRGELQGAFVPCDFAPEEFVGTVALGEGAA